MLLITFTRKSNAIHLAGLINIVENAVKVESGCAPLRPIYLVGDSLGGALALAVAARNPKVDLLLVLANPCKMIFPSL